MPPLDDLALDQLFRTARSYNGYRDQPVRPQDMEAIWNLMKFGPTSANMLPARLVWCESETSRRMLAECASKTNGAKILAAPVTVIVAMDLAFHEHLPTLFPHADARSWFTGNDRLREDSAFRNSSLQGAYLLLAARALGLDTGPMSGFDNAAVDRAFFAATPDVRSNFIVTLGNGDPDTIFERLPRPDFERFNRIV